MITLRNVALQRGTKVLLEGADLTIHAGMRVGLVGPNGAGKSSVFALLTGELHSQKGDVEVPRGWSIAEVAQETPAVDTPAIDYVLDGDRELRAVEREIAAAETANDGERLALAHERFGHIDGYTARPRAGALLAGLGFASADHMNPVRSFSGGWRMRLNLAQALMCRSDLLLLDEPTNHLDLDTVIWLEDWLKSYAGTLVVISHDREFLDGVAQAIVAFEGTKLRLYTGNYSAYEQARATILAQQQSLYARQQREVARLQSFIDRFRAKATKATQAQSRMKALAKMELIAPAHVDSGFTFRFREFPGSPDPALLLDGAAVGYDGRPVLENVTLTIPAGARIGLVGVNGAGKTTLVKLLAGLLPAMAGTRLEGRNLKIGYFAQHQLDMLRADESPLAQLVRLDDRATREQELRDFLGTFNFSGDAALQPAGTMSGGEQARLALALLIWQRPNLLLLDEPTNHLDLDMREALTIALQEFEGAMVLVSHDRHLLRTATDQLMLVADGRVVTYDGDLDDYRAFLEGRAAPAEAPQTAAPPATSRREDRRAAAEARQAAAARRKPLADRAARLEKQMAKLGTEKGRLDALLASEAIYAPEQKEALKQATFDAARVQSELGKLEEEWLGLQIELEALEADA
jgi:ATP-binding cassette subfamily F protein 3